MNLKLKTLLTASVIASFGAAANASIVLEDSFTYSDGELGSVSGGLWVSHSGTTDGQTISSNTLSIDDNGNKDYNRAFSSVVSSGTVYASFDLTVLSSDQPSSASAGGYFAHFGRYSTGTTVDTGSFIARIAAYRPTGSTTGKYTLALGASATPTVNWATELDQDTTYTIVVSYDLATHEAKLWVNPASEASTSISDTAGAPADLAAFMFRVSGTSDGDKTIDNLKVATSFDEAVGIPEPASLGLLALGGLTLISRRRKA